MKTLEKLGWDNFFDEQFENYKSLGFEAGRITSEHKERYLVYTEHGEFSGEISGRFLYSTENISDFPKVGDWAVVSVFKNEEKVIIHNLIRRKNKFSRKFPGGKTAEQVIASNIDFVFIVQSLDENYNIRRMERYVSMVYESKAEPVILLNKSDLYGNPPEKLIEMNKIFPDVKCFILNCLNEAGIQPLKEFIQTGKTYVLVGSSGVGKSTIINKLAEKEIFKTQEVQIKDSKGVHTTTHRQLIILENGGLIIDTPGMRGFKLWNSPAGVTKTFDEIEKYAEDCHFADCTHTSEIKCAVIKALSEGKISEERYKSYLKLQKELRYLETKQDKFSYLESKKKMKILHKAAKDFFKRKNNY